MVKTNSKKSLIAMIAMVVLLIASIAMGITGAWFTATDTAGSNENGSTITFGKVSVTAEATELQVSDSNGTTWSKVSKDGTIVMPGDKVKGGHYKFVISCDDSTGVYYLLAQKVGETTTYYTWDSSSKGLNNYESGALTAVATTETTYTIGFGGSDTAADIAYGSGADKKTGTAIGNDAQGKAIASTYAGAYTIYVIQAKNLEASSAASTIKGLINAEGGFPAVEKTTETSESETSKVDGD